MTEKQVVVLVHRWMTGLFVYDGILFAYLMIMGRLVGQIYGTEVILYLSFFVIVLGLIGLIGSVLYALIKHQYALLWKSLGMFGGTLGLYLLILILALSTIF